MTSSSPVAAPASGPGEAFIDVTFDQPRATEPTAPACGTGHAWARVPREPSQHEREQLKARVRELLKEKNAVLVSHYYVHPDLQDLALETGGIVSDSLEMARFGRDHAARTLVVSSFCTWLMVHFKPGASSMPALRLRQRHAKVCPRQPLSIC